MTTAKTRTGGRPVLKPAASWEQAGTPSVVPTYANGTGKLVPVPMVDGELASGYAIVKYRARLRFRLTDWSADENDAGQRPGQEGLTTAEGWGPTAEAASNAARAACDRRIVAHRQQHLRNEQAKRDGVPVVSGKPVAVQTLAEVAAAALAAMTPQPAPRTVQAYEGMIRNHLAPSALGKMPMHKVKTINLTTWLAALGEAHGRTYVDRGKAVLGHTFSHATANELVASVPVIPQIKTSKVMRARADALAEADKRSRVLTLRDRVSINTYVQSDDYAALTDTADMIRLQLVLGARISELIGLRWSDLVVTHTAEGAVSGLRVSIRQAIAKMPGRDPEPGGLKSKESKRTLPLQADAARLMLARAARFGVELQVQGQPVVNEEDRNNNPVFPLPANAHKHGERVWRHPTQVIAAVGRVFTEGGYPWLTTHGVRRSVITEIADRQTLRHASIWAGHQDVLVTARSYIGASDLEGVALEMGVEIDLE